MQTGHGSSSNGSGGGEGLSRVGLPRFRSAPTTWLESLLEDEEEDPLKATQCLTQLVADNSASPSSPNSLPFASSADPFALEAGFLRQNSSPVDFIDSFNTSVSEGYFSSYGIPASYDSISPNINVSPTGSKRIRKMEVPQNLPLKLPSQVVSSVLLESITSLSISNSCLLLDKLNIIIWGLKFVETRASWV